MTALHVAPPLRAPLHVDDAPYVSNFAFTSMTLPTHEHDHTPHSLSDPTPTPTQYYRRASPLRITTTRRYPLLPCCPPGSSPSRRHTYHVISYYISARHHNSSQPVKPVQSRPQTTTHKQPLALGSESASCCPAFLALSTPSTRDWLESSSVPTCT